MYLWILEYISMLRFSAGYYGDSWGSTSLKLHVFEVNRIAFTEMCILHIYYYLLCIL